MTHHEFCLTYPLGGSNGRHWGAVATASNLSDQVPDSSNERTAEERAFSRAYYARKNRSLEDAGVRAGEIIGYRAWIWKDGRLHSMYAEHAWTPGAVERASEWPSWHGVHAFKTMRQAVEQYHCYACSFTVVFGTVALWGEVIEHESGYRAEYGAVDSLVSIWRGLFPVTKYWWMLWRPDPLEPIRCLYCNADGPSPQT